MPVKLTLEIIKGDMCGKLFTFKQPDKLTIGRGLECQIFLPRDTWVSRLNSVLELNFGRVFIRDLNSKNGTYVNKIKYGGWASGVSDAELPKNDENQPGGVELRQGDRIGIGRTALLVKIEPYRSCYDCGREWADKGSNQSADSEEALICAECEQKRARSRRAAHKSPLHCQKCGSYVSNAESDINGRDYTCSDCRDKLEESTIGFMRQIMRYIVVPPEGRNFPQLSGFELEKELGASGMGAVYLARRRRDDAVVAVNILTTDIKGRKGTLNKIRREVKNCRPCLRCNSVEFVDKGAQGLCFYFLMELEAPNKTRNIPPDFRVCRFNPKTGVAAAQNKELQQSGSS